MSKILLGARTIQILRNFSQINQSLVIKPGNKLATMSIARTVLARADIDENFESHFAIYDLSKFLSVLSLFNEPELTIKENYVTISSGSKRVNYVFADLSLFEGGADKKDPYKSVIKLPSVDVSFKLTQDTFADIKKALGVLKLPEIAVIGDGETIAIEAVDTKNPTGDVYAVDLGKTEGNFRFIMKDENLKLIAGDYDVEISKKNLARFSGVDVEYFVSVEAGSTFGEK